MKRTNAIFLVPAVSVASLWFGASAMAQTATANEQPAASSDNNTIGQVVVVAQKRAENIQRVPIAVSAYSSKQRDLTGIQTIQDMSKFTPGMSYGGAATAITIRGVGRVTTDFGVDPGVATYYDGIYESDTSFVALPTFLVDHTEILRGPQGTLYGRNSIGGAANSISLRPTSTFQGEFEQTIGNYDTSYTGLRVSGPITDNLGYLLAATYDYQGKGYIHNIAGADGGTKGTPFFEGQLDWKPTNNFHLWLKADVSPLHATEQLANSSSPYVTTNPTFVGLVLNPYFGGTEVNPGVRNIYENNVRYTGYVRETVPTQNYIVHADWDLGFSTLKYVGGATRYDAQVTEPFNSNSRRNYIMPYTGSCVPGACPYPNGIPVSTLNILEIDEGTTSFSNELDWTSNGNGPLKWIGGLYQYWEKTHGGFDISNPEQAELQQPVGGPPNPKGVYYHSPDQLFTTSYAVFGQVDYDILPSVTLTGGLRYTWDHKEGTESQSLVYFNPNATSTDQSYFLGNKVVDVAGSWSGFTGRLGLQWRPTQGANLYATVSRGYKSGGFALGDFDANPLVQPEYLTSYEAGWKQTFGRKLQLDTAIFYYDYDNLQAIVSYDAGVAAGGPPSGLVLSHLVNAPKSRSYGFEEEAIYSPIDNLQIMLSYSYLNAQFTRFNNVIDTTSINPVPENLAGKQLPESPHNKIAINGLYTWDLPGGSLVFSATYAWIDQQYSSIYNTPLNLIKGYSDADFRVTWSDAAKRYDVVLYVANAFNKTSLSEVYGSSDFTPIPGFTEARFEDLNAPRTFGAQLRYYFK